jgi:hypothetical protein
MAIQNEFECACKTQILATSLSPCLALNSSHSSPYMLMDRTLTCACHCYKYLIYMDWLSFCTPQPYTNHDVQNENQMRAPHLSRTSQATPSAHH